MPAVDLEVCKGVNTGFGDIWIMEDVIFGIEATDQLRRHRRIDRTSFGSAILEVVLKRIDSGGGNVGIVKQIELGIEVRPRVAPFTPACKMIMPERVQARGAHLRVRPEIRSRR